MQLRKIIPLSQAIQPSGRDNRITATAIRYLPTLLALLLVMMPRPVYAHHFIEFADPENFTDGMVNGAFHLIVDWPHFIFLSVFAIIGWRIRRQMVTLVSFLLASFVATLAAYWLWPSLPVLNQGVTQGVAIIFAALGLLIAWLVLSRVLVPWILAIAIAVASGTVQSLLLANEVVINSAVILTGYLIGLLFGQAVILVCAGKIWQWLSQRHSAQPTTTRLTYGILYERIAGVTLAIVVMLELLIF